MRFVLVNQPMFNRGDESAHKALVYALLQRFPDCSIEVLFTGRPQVAVDECRVDDVRVEYTNLKVDDRYLRSHIRNTKRLLRIFWFMNPVTRDIARRLMKADWVISSPGDKSLGSRYDWDHLFFVSFAEFLGCKLAYYGRSIGPFPDDSPVHARFNYLSRKALRRAKFISLRDPESERIASGLGLDFHSTFDTAFLYTPMASLPPEVKSMLGEGEYIVLVPNYLINKSKDFTGHSSPLQVKLFFTELARRILDRFSDCRVVLLPQFFCGTDYLSTDRAFFMDIAAEVGDDRLAVLPDTLISEYHQTVISGAKCVVGARYHSIVFALNNDVPFVTLNYEDRIMGMLESLGKQDRVVDITQALAPPRGRKSLPEAKIGSNGAASLPFEAEVALARILDRMERLDRDPEACRTAKSKTEECFDALAETIRKTSENKVRRLSR